MQLRDYQVTAVDNIYTGWAAGYNNILYLSGTGTGKTVVFSHIMNHHEGVCVELAHRKELVDQASITLAKRGVMHAIAAPRKNIKLLCKEHIRATGKCWYNPNSNVYVASLKTLLSQKNNPTYSKILQSCTLWVVDECHHALAKNQYGQIINMMPNAKGLGVTATSQRTDGKGLGTHVDGVFDHLVEGPPPSWMMEQGYLTPYEIVAPLSKVQFDEKLRLKNQYRSEIVGDAVQSYLKFSPGEIGATFCSSVELSKLQAEKYNQAGIPAAHLDGTTPTPKRNEILQKLENGEILQLCNVDLVSEGFDLPALSVITVCRKTTSLIWHLQVSGRVLRPAPGKSRGLIIDHVGNYLNPRLGLPDTPRVWSLDRRDKRSQTVNDENIIPTKSCINCLKVYEKTKPACPYCGYKAIVSPRSGPNEVEGDLSVLSPEILREISSAAIALNRSKDEVRDDFLKKTGGNKLIANANAKHHEENKEIRDILRNKILNWRYTGKRVNMDNPECWRLFYIIMGVDVMTAQGLKTAEMKKLIDKFEKMR